MKTLEVESLNKFFGRKQALFDVSFDLEQGSILGLIGPNGAGKSTIMKSIVGLTNYNSGSIKIDGDTLTKNRRGSLENVGSMIESPSPYLNLTGRQNLNLFNDGSTTEEEIQQIMEETQITEFANRKAKKYSLGMKQRLGIAIALLNHPKLLILDEPMNGLDPQSTHDLRDLLVKLSQRGISILISSHLLDELARIADYYVVINHGKVIKKADASSFLSGGLKNIRIEVSDVEKAIEKLKAYGLSPVKYDKGIEIEDNEQGTALNDVIATLSQSNIQILNVTRHQEDLEESLLKLLSEDNNKGVK